MLTEDNYIKEINSFMKEDWESLLDLIPDIEKTEEFGELAGLETDKNGVTTFPFWTQSDIVARFVKTVYEMPVMISFDWGSWDEGRRIARDNSFDFDTIDIPTKCKLITAIVRNDRFCDGALISAFSSGFILKLLKSIRRQVI